MQAQSLVWEDPLGEEMQLSAVFLPGNVMDRGAWQAAVHGIFQARVLEWGAIAFSNALK